MSVQKTILEHAHLGHDVLAEVHKCAAQLILALTATSSTAKQAQEALAQTPPTTTATATVRWYRPTAAAAAAGGGHGHAAAAAAAGGCAAKEVSVHAAWKAAASCSSSGIKHAGHV